MKEHLLLKRQIRTIKRFKATNDAVGIAQKGIRSKLQKDRLKKVEMSTVPKETMKWNVKRCFITITLNIIT